MSNRTKKTAQPSKQTAKRHTTVPTAVAPTIVQVESAPAPETGPVITATVTAVETTPETAATTVTAEPGVAVAEAPPVQAPVTQEVDGQVIAGLIRDLRDPDADISREAAIALGETGSSAAVDALIDVLENADGFYHSVVRSAAASSLAKLGDKRAVASLLGAVNDTMAEASAEAVRALAELGDARAVTTLVGVVQNVTGFYQPVVRLAAVHALGRFDAPEATAERAYVAADPNEDTVIRNAGI